MKIFENGGHNPDLIPIYYNTAYEKTDWETWNGTHVNTVIDYVIDPFSNVTSTLEKTSTQIFISFTTDGKGVGKGFTAKIIFGIGNNC